LKSSFHLLFENKDLVVVEKFPLTLSVPSRMGVEDPRPVVGIELEKKLAQRIYPIHRLDYEVAGLLIFAKTSEAQRWGNTAFEEKRIRKTYWGVAPRKVPLQINAAFTWEDRIHRGKKRSFVAPHGKDATTHAKFLRPHATHPAWDLWELEPLTGRPHQLRVQMMLHAQPLVGDELYGSTEKWTQDGIALKAVRLQIPENPFGLPAVFECPLEGA
jgi:tRNA pseudouridine32 synthase / 23S rRNA pseudouridine746 synthase